MVGFFFFFKFLISSVNEKDVFLRYFGYLKKSLIEKIFFLNYMRKCYVNTAFVFKAVSQLASFSPTGSKGKPCVFSLCN